MNSELPFPGFRESIQEPLASSDQRSFALIKRIFIENKASPAQPFTILLQTLTGKSMINSDAMTCWHDILKHKLQMQQNLGRTVGIQTAAIDYFECRSPAETLFRVPLQNQQQIAAASGEAVEQLYNQGYHLEKLKEEILRAKRYKHALSVIMFDIDDFSTIMKSLCAFDGDRVMSTIVNIIKKTIRNVDYFYRMSADRFFLILPNTNQREAKELAERIRVQIPERTARLSMMSGGVTVSLSVGQCSHSDSSIDFVRRIERLLEEGKRSSGKNVFSLT